MKILITVIVLGGIGFGLWGVVKSREATPLEGEQVYCTMEAKLCPDGSYVGRTGPNCEFTPCPSGENQGILPMNSGVHGEILVGPTCPVEHIPPQAGCEDRPLSTLVAIFRASDTVHAHVITESDKDGKFSAALAPGDYVIGAGEATLPRCPQTPVKVVANQYTSIKITCDSGIR